MNFLQIFIGKYGGTIVKDCFIPAFGMASGPGVLYDIMLGVNLTEYFRDRNINNLYINHIHMETLIMNDIDIEPMNSSIFLW